MTSTTVVAFIKKIISFLIEKSSCFAFVLLRVSAYRTRTISQSFLFPFKISKGWGYSVDEFFIYKSGHSLSAISLFFFSSSSSSFLVHSVAHSSHSFNSSLLSPDKTETYFKLFLKKPLPFSVSPITP